MANNLEVAGRQRTHMNGRGARLRSALELLHMINPFNLNCLLQLARFYMLYNMDLKPLMKTIESLQPVSISPFIQYHIYNFGKHTFYKYIFYKY